VIKKRVMDLHGLAVFHIACDDLACAISSSWVLKLTPHLSHLYWGADVWL